MTILMLILALLLWGCSAWLLWRRELLAPVASWLALLALRFAGSNGVYLLPLNNNILIAWMCITLVVTAASAMQPAAVMSQTRGLGYMSVGAVTGMVIGLLSSTFTTDINMLYGFMVVATVVGTFFGFLLFTRTPQGRDVNLASGRFFRYLLAKGFPVAVTVMMAGVALVLAVAVTNQAPDTL